MGLKSEGNHGALQAKSTCTNFQGLVFIPKTMKLLLWDLQWKEKYTNQRLGGGLRMEDQDVQSPETSLV